MDEDRTKGAASTTGGKAEDAVGGLAGDAKMQAEGKLNQAAERAQDAYGSARDQAREGASAMGAELGSFISERPAAALLASATYWAA